MGWPSYRTPQGRGLEILLALALYLVFTNALIVGLSLAYAVLPWYASLPLRLVGVFGGPFLFMLAAERWPRFSGRQAVSACMVVSGFAIFMMSGQNHLSNYAWLARGDNIESVTVADANEHPDASYMRLENAQLRSDLALFHKWYGDEETYYYHAVPIVDRDWEPGDSILVWAVSDEREFWALERAPETVPLQGFFITNHRSLRRTLRSHKRALNPWAVALELSELPYEAQLVYTWRKVRGMFWLANGVLLGLWGLAIFRFGY